MKFGERLAVGRPRLGKPCPGSAPLTRGTHNPGEVRLALPAALASVCDTLAYEHRVILRLRIESKSKKPALATKKEEALTSCVAGHLAECCYRRCSNLNLDPVRRQRIT